MSTRRRAVAPSARRFLPWIECLEERACPAVSAVLTAPDTLVLRGSATGSVVDLNIDKDGTVNGSVTGRNGAVAALVPRTGIQNLVIRTRGAGNQFNIIQSTPAPAPAGPLAVPLRIVSDLGKGSQTVNLIFKDDIAGALNVKLRGGLAPDELKVQFDGDILLGADVNVDLAGGRGADTLHTANNGTVAGRLLLASNGGRGGEDNLASMFRSSVNANGTFRGGISAPAMVAVSQDGGRGDRDQLMVANDANAPIGGQVVFAGDGGVGDADEVTLIGRSVLADAVFFQDADGGAGDRDRVTCGKERVQGVAICAMSGGRGKGDVLDIDVTDVLAGGSSLSTIRGGRGSGKVVDARLHGTLDGTSRFEITGGTDRRGGVGDTFQLDISDLDGGSGTFVGVIIGSPGDDVVQVANSSPANMAGLAIQGILFDGGGGTNSLAAPAALRPLVTAGIIDITNFETVTFVAPTPPGATPPPPPPAVPWSLLSLSISDVSVAEGDSGSAVATFTVTLSAPASTITQTAVEAAAAAAAAAGRTVTVNYATANGTAQAGSDYTAASGMLTFSPGQTSKTISVAVRGDTLSEPNETFFVNLSYPVNTTIADAQGAGKILDDDSAGGGGLLGGLLDDGIDDIDGDALGLAAGFLARQRNDGSNLSQLQAMRRHALTAVLPHHADSVFARPMSIRASRRA